MHGNMNVQMIRSVHIQPTTSAATAANSVTCWHYVLLNGLWQYVYKINKEEHEKKQFISRRQMSISGQLIIVLNSNKVWRHKFASRELQDLTVYVRNIRTLWQAIVFVFMRVIIQHNSNTRHHAGHVFYYLIILGNHFCSFDFVRYKTVRSSH
jgi:hypothetical protein